MRRKVKQNLPADLAAFEAVPAVLKRGIQVNHHEQHKGGKVSSTQNVESWTFAAPVAINGKTGNMAVVVQKTTGTFYKAHKILTPDGSAFVIDKINEAESGPVQGATLEGRLVEPTDSASTDSIHRKSGKSQAKSSGRASVDVSFGRNVDEWLKSTPEDKRSTSPGYFRVGTTSEALQSIGARTDNIYMRKSKIGTIFEDHPEMDADIIKKIPDILENPILIAKSLTRSDSIVLLSEEKTNNGENLMVALELTPKPGGSTEAEFSLVTSAYGRGDGNLQNLINNSELLYLDTNKKRADTWLMQLRVQFPSRQPPYGSIDTIAYTESGVKITGKKLNELGGTIRKIRSGRASTDISRINSRTKKELLEAGSVRSAQIQT